ncbi:hypothetical protein [Lysobacter xanthus]
MKEEAALLVLLAAPMLSHAGGTDETATRELTRRCENAAVAVVAAYVREPLDDTARTVLVRAASATSRTDAVQTAPTDTELVAAYSSVALQLPELPAAERTAPLAPATQLRLAARASAVCMAVAGRQGAP